MSQFLSYLLILSFFFFFFINSLGTNSSPLLEICPSHLCGDVNISYPFWVLNESASDQQQYCGYPGFGVMCLNGTAVLGLHDDQYHVEDINYADYTLALVDIDVSNQTCPRARHSVSLEPLPLKYSSMDLNLIFYFNCTSDPLVPVPSNSIQCLNIGSYRSYVFVENHETEVNDWSKNCEEKVVVTVRQTQINMTNLTGGFGRAMNDGFVLDWETVKDCVTCESSEGYCGYNAAAEEFLCFCKDGSTHRNSCKGVTDGNLTIDGVGKLREVVKEKPMAFTDFSNDHLVMVQLKGNPQTNSAYLIKLELLVAKNLIAANLNGTSDPYAIITCGTEKRFSSMVLGSRNPMWGKEFNFAVEELPIENIPVPRI